MVRGGGRRLVKVEWQKVLLSFDSREMGSETRYMREDSGLKFRVIKKDTKA